jgi:hypothetical protein
MERNWKNEVSELREQLEWLNLSAGQHRVVFLDNGAEKRLVQYKDGTGYKVDFKVQQSGSDKVKVWSVSKADEPTSRSLWGQLSLYAADQGTLVGKEVTVLVKGEGTSKDYTIMEAISLSLPKDQKTLIPVEESV